MDKGYLIVTVYKNNVASPISGAQIIIRGDNYEQTFTTNESGKTPKIELDAPLKKYSLTPQTEVRPYSIYQVEASKTGYETTIINGVQIFPDVTSLQDVYLNETSQREETKDEVKTIDIPPHSLWEESQQNTSRKGSINDFRVYPQVFIPEYVIVHNGTPTDTTASNYYVPFTDYIKNVASGEIYATWPTESLRANIYAILSFTMNRIYTEWYKSQGYNFTVTSLPKYDQLYTNNRTIFKSISDVVDDIFYYHIELTNKNYPLLAQYDDGVNVNNPGWLSQWGTVTLANQGYSALEMLKYYYTDGLTLNSANEIEGLPLSFPGYNLEEKMCNEAVQKIQIMLNTISGSYPRIPKISPADGRYQNSTTESVKVFQEIFNLPITGIVDFNTWFKISYIYIAVSKMLQGIVKN